jgi:surfeit locus 1 family protein
MSATLSFRPTLIPTAAAIVGVVVTALLGDWQLNRAAYKAELEARIREAARQPPVRIGSDTIEPQSILYHNVEARGEFDSDRTVYLDNRVHQGRAGYQVVSPLKIAGSSRYVLVERGWVAAGPDRRQLPPVATPAGEIDVTGLATPANPPVFELSKQVQAGKLWQNLTVDRYRSHFALDLQPTIIQQHNDLPDGLIRDWQPPSLGIERHRAYALQWFSMALAILVLYVVLNVRRNPRPA